MKGSEGSHAAALLQGLVGRASDSKSTCQWFEPTPLTPLTSMHQRHTHSALNTSLFNQTRSERL